MLWADPEHLVQADASHEPVTVPSDGVGKPNAPDTRDPQARQYSRLVLRLPPGGPRSTRRSTGARVWTCNEVVRTFDRHHLEHNQSVV